MPHQVNLCTCGRTIHWPQNAVAGTTTWTCKRCGTNWRLVPRNTPGADGSGQFFPSEPHRASVNRTAPAATRPIHRSPTPQRPASLLDRLLRAAGIN